jgi:hypothetical protein
MRSKARRVGRVALLAAMSLAGCESGPTGPDLATVEQQCGAATRPFEDSWPCIRVGFAGRQDGYPLVRDQYLATGDVVAEKVRAGQMTQAEAKLAMTRARNQAAAASTPPRAVVCLPFNGVVVCR